ncbi:hypothetical protein ACOJIV_20900 [Haloarcula sp. AONF1]
MNHTSPTRPLGERADDVVDREETYIVPLGGGFLNAVREPAPGGQRVFDGSRPTARRLSPEFLYVLFKYN